MKKHLLIVMLIQLVLTGCFATTTVKFDSNSHNPVISESNLADPHVIKHNGVYYMYPTSNGRGSPARLYVYSSSDLRNWTKHNVAFSKGVNELWAPDVFYHEATDTFYMYYTQSNSYTDIKIGIATSKTPYGPFDDKGILTDGIDAHVFQDDDGQIYFYWTKAPAGFLGQGPIAVRKMDPLSPTRFIGEEKIVIRANQGWENIFTGSPEAMFKFMPITEGAFIVKRNGTYYMLYSGGFFASVNYSTGYATSNSPMGDFTKSAKNPILSAFRQQGLSGPGHVAVVENNNGGLSIIYHGKSKGEYVEGGGDRYISEDTLWFDGNGEIQIGTSFLNPNRL
ncbi:glycoside hydrolase family 43 protein [Grimontia sp. NTOU-MAR1]|uniref:glycoside hydrolase family 43 protein n=1 Tax=Grimontia sp. NTOU-MAR1 TaxID=3111011 RepID=UPI002DB8EBD3|nr:glycoside hydrolase family 43 protein [Grimontia sp. NTOU-MAR1]WRV97239.1 glycoside hydrolase family 43 protein [Grimontia sp. NTOU-MAR1]